MLSCAGRSASVFSRASLPEDLPRRLRAWDTRRWLLPIEAVFPVRHAFSKPRANSVCNPLWGRDRDRIARSAGTAVAAASGNRTGYRNLCRLLTAMKAGRPKGEGAAGYALLATHAEGLIALAGASPRDDVAELAVVFPAGHLYLEVHATWMPCRSIAIELCWRWPPRTTYQSWPPMTCATPRPNSDASTTC